MNETRLLGTELDAVRSTCHSLSAQLEDRTRDQDQSQHLEVKVTGNLHSARCLPYVTDTVSVPVGTIGTLGSRYRTVRYLLIFNFVYIGTGTLLGYQIPTVPT